MARALWQRVEAAAVERARVETIDAATAAAVAQIIAAVRAGGEAALRQQALRFGDLAALEAPLVVGQQELASALHQLPPAEQQLLERTAARIAAFAQAQRAALQPVKVSWGPGQEAGHFIAPVERAGCYAPGGRFPLPSSVLMTAVTARVAGVNEVWVASPRPTVHTLAAAAVAGADGVLAVGGAQAIAALAYGVAGVVPACDVIVGPGNRFVTAAKQQVAGQVGIDMLAGPSELVVLADETAEAAVIAADLLAQCEHDSDAFAALVCTDAAVALAVEEALAAQLVQLPEPSQAAARAALSHSLCVVVDDLEQGAAVCDALAPEHLEVQVRAAAAPALVQRLRHYGALFVGTGAAEVFGDYGAGPNHVLPTGGGARFSGGLSVFAFLRVRTWMQVERAAAANWVADAASLARLEGLEAHARAAEVRVAADPARNSPLFR